MADISEYEGKINTNLDSIVKEIEGLDKKDEQKKKLLMKKIQLHLKQASQLVDAYELELDGLDAERANIYRMSLTNCKDKLQNVKLQFEFKKNEQQDNNLYGDAKSKQQYIETDVSKMNQEQLINHVDNKQEEALKDLEQIEIKVEDGNQVADGVLLEMDQQIEKLHRMGEEANETKMILKRTKRLIQYFGRVVHTDKIIMGLMGCICVAILVLIILSMTGTDDGKLNVPDKLPSRFLTQQQQNSNDSNYVNSQSIQQQYDDNPMNLMNLFNFIFSLF